MAFGAAKSIYELAVRKKLKEEEGQKETRLYGPGTPQYERFAAMERARKARERRNNVAEPVTTGLALGKIAGYVAPFALQGIGRLFGQRSANRESQRRRDAQMAQLRVAEDQLRALNFGPTASEGGLFRALERRSLTKLGQRGVLRGSTAPSEVAAAMAPAEMQFQKRRQDATFSLAALRARIEGGTSEQGFGDAFGQTLGDAGSFVAQSMATRDTIGLLHKYKMLGLEED